MYTEEYYQGGLISNYSRYQDHPYNSALLNLILQYKQKGKLLEIGCAYGYFLRRAEMYFDSYGIDISKHAIEHAKKNTKSTKLFVGDIERIFDSFETDLAYDVIVALDVLEHLHNPNKILHELSSHLKNDGYLFFRVPNTECIDYQFYSLINKKEKWHGLKDKTHISLLTLQEWIKTVKSVGFEYDLIPYVPTRYLKEMALEKFPNRFFLRSIPFLTKTNKSITFMCKKHKPL